jgi:hypothetical protein
MPNFFPFIYYIYSCHFKLYFILIFVLSHTYLILIKLYSNKNSDSRDHNSIFPAGNSNSNTPYVCSDSKIYPISVEKKVIVNLSPKF